MLQDTRRVAVRGASAALATLALALGIRAHDVHPAQVTLRPGGKDFIYVIDQFGCPATITATSLDPAKVQVFALDMNNPTVLLGGNGTTATVPNRVDQVFVVVAQAGVTGPATALINICWVGSTAPLPPCPENNCNPPTPHQVIALIEPRPGTFSSAQYCGIVGDPVTSDDGELFFEEPADIDLHGPFDLAFQRFYASRIQSDGNAAGALGPNWLSNFDWKLTTVGNNVEIFTPTGRVIRFERDYLQTAWKLAVFEDFPFQLVDSGAGKLLTDPRTGVVRDFDVNGRLISIKDGKGNTLTVTAGASGPNVVSDGLGRTLTFGYTSGRLTSISDGTRTASFAYTSGVLTSATDTRGKVTTYAYDATQPGEALMTSRMRPEGNTPWTQTYDTSKRVVSQSDSANHTSTLAFAGATHQTTITNPLGDDQVHTHSTDGELTRLVDEATQDVTAAYDAQNRRKSVTDRLGRTTSWTFHAASGQLASTTEANGAKTTFGYQARIVASGTIYDLASITRADGTNEAFDYDAQGNLTTWTDPAGNDWAYSYNARGQVLTATNPEGGVTTNTYNPNATLATAMDNAGNVTTFAYDALRRLQTLTHPDTTTVGYTYDAHDHLLSITDELSHTTTLVWDDNGNLVSLTEPTLDTWNFAYDAMDRLTGVTDPLGNAANVGYDELGRVATVSNAEGDGLAFAYDARGRLASLTDDLGGAWGATYDVEGVPTGASDPLSNATGLTTDGLGRPTALTSPLGNRTQFVYDALGRTTQVRDPAGNATVVRYDARGLPDRVTLPGNGGMTTLTRNALGQVTAVDQPGAADSTFAYDDQGRALSITDPLGRATTYTYDTRSRVDQATLPGTLGTVDATWDDADRLVRAQYADGTDLQYGYDESGHLTSANGLTLAYDGAGRVSTSNGLTIGRDDAGRVTSVDLDPGKTLTYVYDARGLLTSIADWAGGATQFGYDAAGRLTSLARPNDVTTTYGYDADGHVTSIVETLASPFTGTDVPVVLSEFELEYDVRGQIKSIDANTPRTGVPQLGGATYMYDAGGQQQGLEYDEFGRVVRDDDFWGNQDDFWCNWDDASRPQQIKIKARIVLYSHDGLDRIIGRDSLVKSNVSTYGRNYAFPTAPITKETLNGATSQYFVHNPAGGLLYAIDALSNSRRFYHFDWRGSTNFLSDDSGAITDSYAYSATGAELAHNGTSPNRFTFRGYFGSFKHNARLFFDTRLYDAGAGKYLQRDLGTQWYFDPRSSNPYTYAHGNPNSLAFNAESILPIASLSDVPVVRSSGAGSLFGPSAVLNAALGTTAPIEPSVLTGWSAAATLSYDAPGSAGFDWSSVGRYGGSKSGAGDGFALSGGVDSRNLALGYLALTTPTTAAAPTNAANDRAARAAPAGYRELIAKLRVHFPQYSRSRPVWEGRYVYPSWYFSDDNAKTLAKLLSHSSPNVRYWVFAAGTTDVRFKTADNNAPAPALSKLPIVGDFYRNRVSDEQRKLVPSIHPRIVNEWP